MSHTLSDTPTGAPGLSFEAFLAEQRIAYLEKLPGRLAQIEEHAARVLPAGGNAADVRALELSVHSLTGSAGTFGLSGLTRAARTLELSIEDAGAGAWPAPAAQAVAVRLEALRAALAQTLRASARAEDRPC